MTNNDNKDEALNYQKTWGSTREFKAEMAEKLRHKKDKDDAAAKVVTPPPVQGTPPGAAK